MLKREIEPTSTTRYVIGPISANNSCIILKVETGVAELRFSLTSFSPRLKGGILGNAIYDSQLSGRAKAPKMFSDASQIGLGGLKENAVGVFGDEHIHVSRSQNMPVFQCLTLCKLVQWKFIFGCVRFTWEPISSTEGKRYPTTTAKRY
jgi:hypothetical protein